MTKTLMKDTEHMEEIMARTADRCDLWQDRFIYWIAVAIYHILIHLKRQEERRANE